MSQAEASGEVPAHVAIIMDGNGRWAKQRGLIRSLGHEAGGEHVKRTLEAAHNLGVKQLTLYAFSTENWKRPKAEVSFLMDLLVRFLRRETGPLDRDNVIFKTVGDLSRFPEKVRKEIEHSRQALADNTGITLCLALNYGSRDEIVRAARRFGKLCVEDPARAETLDEAGFAKLLDSADGLPEVDLLIRTAGEQRLSNFLLWQISYAELHFSPVFWPDFTPDLLRAAIEEFKTRSRRFGGL